LIAWLAARSLGGKIILRVEDLDATRLRPEALSGALVDLRWLGLDYDEGPDAGGPSAPYLQSRRRELYEAALERLKQSESVYPCTCKRSDVARVAAAPHPEDEGPSYPGTCAGRCVSDAHSLSDRPFAWRFRVPPGPVAWRDLVRGPVALDRARLGGDFIVARSPFAPAYQLAVVTDDAAMRVTQVIRGDDLVPSTPRQILLYRQLGWPAPDFGHVPLAVTPDGRRLAKREGSIKLATLRQNGADPRRLVGWLARSCGWADAVIPSTPHDWIGRSDPLSLPADPWVVTPEILEDLVR
jgi:glutamyl-tRNA synthetase